MLREYLNALGAQLQDARSDRRKITCGAGTGHAWLGRPGMTFQEAWNENRMRNTRRHRNKSVINLAKKGPFNASRADRAG